jgi:hypothetical protein
MAYKTCSIEKGVVIYKTFIDAYNASINDKSIWKLSFNVDRKEMRWRLKTKSDNWLNENCITQLSEEYKMEQNQDRVFWVLQITCDFEYLHELFAREKLNEITRKEIYKLLARANIKCVLTTEEFVNKFKML